MKKFIQDAFKHKTITISLVALMLLPTLTLQAQTSNSTINYIDQKGREWKRLDSTKFLLLNQVKEICNPVCSGVLQGWTWANQEETLQLLKEFHPEAPIGGGVEIAGYAENFSQKMGFTYILNSTYQPYQNSSGYTSSANDEGVQIVAGAEQSSNLVSMNGNLYIGAEPAGTAYITKGYFLIKNGQGLASCNFEGMTYQHNALIPGFLQANVPYGEVCQAITRQCINGVIHGSLFSRCQVEQPKSCVYNQQNLAHNQSQTRIIKTVINKKGKLACRQEITTCTNGVITQSKTTIKCPKNK